MGDAEKAQLNAITEEFPDAMPLMCYFHVLYNVDKKTKAFSRIQRKMVYEWIYKMHFARDDADLSKMKRCRYLYSNVGELHEREEDVDMNERVDEGGDMNDSEALMVYRSTFSRDR
jgi:hypothetical protein